MQRAFMIQHGFGLETVAGHAGEAHGGLRRRDSSSGSGNGKSNQDRQSAQFHRGKPASTRLQGKAPPRFGLKKPGCKRMLMAIR